MKGLLGSRERRFGLMQATFWAYIGTFFLYIVTLLSARGLSSSQIGYLTALLTVASMVGQPIMGALSDATRRNRAVYIGCCVAEYLAFVALYFSKNLWQMAISIVFIGLMKDPAACVLDSWLIKALPDGTGAYGRLRGMGSIAVAVEGLFYGFLLDHFGLGLMPVAAGITLCLLVAAALTVPELAAESAPHTAEKKTGMTAALRATMTPRLVGVLLFFLVLGVTAQPMYNFMPKVLEMLGGSSRHLGLMYFLNAATEGLFMQGLGSLKKLSAEKRMLLSCVLYASCTALVALCGNLYLSVGLMVINGAAWGLHLPARREMIAQLVSERFQTTMQGMSDMLYAGLGLTIGSALTGNLLDAAGLRTAFLVLAAGEILSTLVLVGAMRLRKTGDGKVALRG